MEPANVSRDPDPSGVPESMSEIDKLRMQLEFEQQRADRAEKSLNDAIKNLRRKSLDYPSTPSRRPAMSFPVSDMQKEKALLADASPSVTRQPSAPSSPKSSYASLRDRQEDSSLSGKVESSMRAPGTVAVEPENDEDPTMANTGHEGANSESKVQAQPETSEAQAVLTKVVQDNTPRWKKNRDTIDHKTRLWAAWSGFWGIAGLCSAIAQNEIVIRGGDPDTPEMTGLKAMNLTTTLICMYCVWEVNKLEILFERVTQYILCNQHLETDISVSCIFTETLVWLEFLIILPHLPPLTTFEFGATSMGNNVVYRGETLMCLFNTFRLYLLWRSIKYLVLSPYPKRHTVSMYTSAKLQSSFALKVMFDGWFAAFYVSCFWTCLLVYLGYLYRAVELSACHWVHTTHHLCQTEEAVQWTFNGVEFFAQENDIELANAIWAMFVASSSVGYGDDVPSTHLGRFVAAASALSGIVLVSLLTAAVGIGLIYTPIQQTALSWLEREKARDEIKRWAASYITVWWKQRCAARSDARGSASHPRFLAHGNLDRRMYVIRRHFNRARTAGQVDLNDFAVDSVKVNQIFIQIGILQIRLSELHTILSSKPLPPLPSPICRRPAAETAGDDSDVEAQSNTVQRFHSSSDGEEESSASPGAAGAGGEEAAAAGPATTQSPYTAWPGRGLLKVPLAESLHNAEGVRWQAPPEGRERSFLRRAGMLVEGGNAGWRKDRKQVERFKNTAAGRASWVGLAGTACAVGASELLLGGSLPGSAEVVGLKAANSAATALLLLELWKVHFGSVLLNRLKEHTRGAKFDHRNVWKSILRERTFWMEVVICVLHCPPGFTFETGGHQSTNYVMYRGETILAAVNTLRVYLFAREWKRMMLADLPRKHTVGEFLAVEIGYTFAVKRAFNSLSAVLHLCVLWLLLVLLLAYWFRSAEYSACSLPSARDDKCALPEASEWSLQGKPIDSTYVRYYPNAAWIVWVTASTVGYGDMFPVTHAGRVVASLAAVAGLLMAAMTTASMWSALNRTQEEEAALNMLKRYKAKQRMLEKAVDLLSLWWRRRTGKGMTLRQRFSDIRKQAKLLNKSKRETNVGLDSVKSMSAHLNDLTYESRDLVRQVDDILWLAQEKDAAEQPPRKAAGNAPAAPLVPAEGALRPASPLPGLLADVESKINNAQPGAGAVRRQSTAELVLEQRHRSNGSGQTGRAAERTREEAAGEEGPGGDAGGRQGSEVGAEAAEPYHARQAGGGGGGGGRPAYGLSDAKSGVEGAGAVEGRRSVNLNPHNGPGPVELPGTVTVPSGEGHGAGGHWQGSTFAEQPAAKEPHRRASMKMENGLTVHQPPLAELERGPNGDGAQPTPGMDELQVQELPS